MNYAKIFGNSHSLYVANDEIKSRKFQNEIYTYIIVYVLNFQLNFLVCMLKKYVVILFWRFLPYFFTYPGNSYHCLINYNSIIIEYNWN